MSIIKAIKNFFDVNSEAEAIEAEYRKDWAAHQARMDEIDAEDAEASARASKAEAEAHLAMAEAWVQAPRLGRQLRARVQSGQ